MANFFEGIGNLLKHPIDEIKWMADETKGVVKPLLKGDISESWDSFKGSFGRHNEMMEDITVPLGGRNKLTENPDAVAGTIVGGIMAAPLIGGAMGGASSGSGSGFGGFGTEGAFSKYFSPVSNKFSSIYDSIAGPSDNVLGMMSDMEAGGATGTGSEAISKAQSALGGGMDLESLGKMLQSIKSEPDYKINASGGASGRGFRFDQEPYKNKLAQQDFASMYGTRAKPKY